MKVPHKHADLIKAWADGAVIQVLNFENTWCAVSNPCWDYGYTYRIKPERKPDETMIIPMLTNSKTLYYGSRYPYSKLTPSHNLHLVLNYTNPDPELISARLEKI
jgi:hypothetical protein